MNELFWKNVKSILKNRGLSQNLFASEINVNERTFQDWVYSKKLPSTEMTKRIADNLGVSVDFLLTGDASQSEAILTAQEKQLIDWFRKAPPVLRQFLLRNAEQSSRTDESGNVEMSELEKERIEMRED